MATEDDPDINGLQSEIIYYKLNKASDDYTQDSENFWNTAIAYHPMNKLSIFPSLAKGFYYVSKMNVLDKYYDERWNFLYFWAGIKMIENLEGSDSLHGFSFKDLMDLLKMVRSINDNGSSYTDDMLKMNKDNFKDLKEVYDYLENYESINLKIDFSGNSPCTARYKEYVTKAHELYKREKAKCHGNNKDEYCRILNSFLLKQ
ncbi:PIR Superfamily Protein [Plasmodium ovale wallikeri]|uniref:PIR Superfamily Protein n=1 Tax=Plasmodium ovale wallikeri TaxID=864142 RepID=A0A1A9AS77_PLAOA|nr:PIR Superfamily Protein [Plasmodium ovale wallikeri]